MVKGSEVESFEHVESLQMRDAGSIGTLDEGVDAIMTLVAHIATEDSEHSGARAPYTLQGGRSTPMEEALRGTLATGVAEPRGKVTSPSHLDALLGNSAKVVMERVKRFPMTASFKKNKEPAPADNPNFYLCGQFASQITELYYHEVSEIQRSLEELCYNGEP